jgi:DNA mismatch repair protein MSH6
LKEIKQRQDAVTELLDNNELLQEIRLILGQIPDLERNLAQIHSLGNKERHNRANHPDARAVLYEELTYGKKKVLDFISTLNGFERLAILPKLFKNCDSKLLKYLTQYEKNGGAFPNMSEELKFFKNGFDHDQALKDGLIAPEKGVDTDYDEAEAKIKEINKELAEYLKEQEKYFGCRIIYFGTDKKRYQLEIPESNSRKANADYELRKC